MFNNRGFTLIELICVICILGIVTTLFVCMNVNARDSFALKNTSYEIRNALQLAQQLSIDECQSYRFEIIGRDYIVKQDFLTGREVLRKNLLDGINVCPTSNQYVTFNRNGVTTYSSFTFKNKFGNGVRVETLIGTGRVQIINI